MNEDVCRICRGEETPEEPLFHPCRCSGSIKYVHQECLLEWLQHARVRTRCDVCGTSYVLRKRYKPGMADELPLNDYLLYTTRSLRDNYHVIYYIVRGVLMVSFLAVFAKYMLEFAVIFTERSPSMLNDFQASYGELIRRIKQKPPRRSLIPMLDSVLSLVIPQSEFTSAWINGILLMVGFICSVLFCWFMAMWVLNEQALLHDLEHIELGEMSHMDQGDDEDLLADLHPHNNNTLQEVPGHSQDGQPVQDPEEPVEFTPRSDIYEDLRPEHVVRMEEDELAGNIDDDEGAEELGVFLRRLLVDLFGGPNNVVLPGFLSALVFFGTLASSYPSFYWPSLLFKHFSMSAMISLARALNMPPYVSDSIRSVLGGVPQGVLGHIILIGTVQCIVLTTIRLSILYNMKMLLKRNWGKNLVIVGYQAYAVIKTLLMTMIETLVFPQFCGILLHVAVLPITPSWSWHWDKYKEHPYWTYFLQWLSGYLYMHGFQIFVGACRKFFRKGVLFFLHDNDAVYFMRSIMLLSLPKQLRRISVSAAIYGSFIFFGIGSACLLLRLLEPSSWPLEVTYWPGDKCLKLWPFIVILSSFSVPLTRSGKKLKNVLSLWLTERVWLRMFSVIAKTLDLESWLFAIPRELTDEENEKLSKGDTSAGCFVRAPVDFPLRPRRSLNLFIPVTKDNERLDGKTGVQPNELSKYTLVWRPPHFQYRIALLAALSWSFITVITFMFTLIPLQVGRFADKTIFGKEIRNDIILTLTGLTVCLPVYALSLRRFAPRELELCVRFMTIFGDLPQPKKADTLPAAFWAIAFYILSLNSYSSWDHWLVFSPNSRSILVSLFSLVLNLTLFFIGNLYSLVWCNAIATADFFIWQAGLEQVGLVKKSSFPVSCGVLVLAMYRVWQVWYSSRSAKQLSESVRETLYLDSTEVRNYEPENQPAVNAGAS